MRLGTIPGEVFPNLHKLGPVKSLIGATKRGLESAKCSDCPPEG